MGATGHINSYGQGNKSQALLDAWKKPGLDAKMGHPRHAPAPKKRGLNQKDQDMEEFEHLKVSYWVNMH